MKLKVAGETESLPNPTEFCNSYIILLYGRGERTDISEGPAAAVGSTLRDTVPFLVIMIVWIVVMLVLCGVFLVTIPEDVSYGGSIHAPVFVPPLVGLFGHTLREALKQP